MFFRWVARKLLVYFEKPRGKLSCFIGGFFVVPALNDSKNRMDSLEKSLSEERAMYGRLELLSSLLTHWYNEPAREAERQRLKQQQKNE